MFSLPFQVFFCATLILLCRQKHNKHDLYQLVYQHIFYIYLLSQIVCMAHIYQDFVVITIFVTVSAAILFGKKWIRILPAGPIFLGGSAIILSLDAFFPYDTLGPLQYFVPYLVQTNVWIINIFDLGIATARDNLMFLQGEHGPFALQVFWPSAGVHSVIIYSLVMMAFLLKMNIQRKRKALYFGLGIIGTIIINLIRIFSLSLFALKVSTNPVEFEEYHSVAGEIMFLPWLFVFLLVVTFIESRRLKKKEISTKSNL